MKHQWSHVTIPANQKNSTIHLVLNTLHSCTGWRERSIFGWMHSRLQKEQRQLLKFCYSLVRGRRCDLEIFQPAPGPFAWLKVGQHKKIEIHGYCHKLPLMSYKNLS